MNAHRWLQTNDAGLSKSLERLSSGYRINKAADDAAGLAISSGFRADIASYSVAYRNTSEANSLLQVAEGGMDQIGNMLTRLKELATQASSANVGSTERSKINAEGNALVSEIDRIAQNTKYGSTSLLDGTFGASQTTGGYTTDDTNYKVFGTMTHTYSIGGNANTGATSAGITLTAVGSNVTAGNWTFDMVDATTISITNGSVTEQATFAAPSSSAGETISFSNLGLTLTINSATTDNAIFSGSVLVLKDTGVTNLNVTGANTGNWTIDDSVANTITISNGTITETMDSGDFTAGTAATLNFSSLGISFALGTNYSNSDLDDVVFTVSSTGSGGSTFQVGAENSTNDQISLSLNSVRATASTGLGLTYDFLDSASEAQSMITLVDTAISTLSDRRADVGAGQNRLSYAGANLSTVMENVTAAESVIRDVDMAAEMTAFTKNQIMMQAGTAMLAQANMMPQQVLALFG